MSGVDERVLTAAYELGMSHGLSMYGMLSKPVMLADLHTKLAAVQKQDRVIDRDELKRGLDAGEIVPYYQPKASLTDRGWVIDGVEALARWQHPRLGIVMPDEFVSLAERTGLIGDLTNAVLASSLRQMKQWNDEGMRLTCAINLAADARHGFELSRSSGGAAHAARARRQPARARDHRDRDDAESDDDDGHPHAAAREAHQSRAGRLRHRLSRRSRSSTRCRSTR